MKKSNKNFFILCIGILLFIGILNNIFKKEKEVVSKSAAPKITEKYNVSQEIENMIERIKLDKSNSVKKEDAKAYLQRFINVRDTINKYANSSNSDIKKKISELRKSQSEYQINYFPKMRKTFGEDLKEMLWRENIEVDISGKNNEILHITGGKFVSNANKEDFTKSIETHLINLRFKRIYYKWFKYDKDGIYYEFTVDKDSEI